MVNEILKRQKGFTLIELMLATSLLMLVLFSGYYGYSLYSDKWQKRVSWFWKSTQNEMILTSMDRMFAATIGYVVDGMETKKQIHFIGKRNSVEFVTKAPIYSNGTALVKFEFIKVGESHELRYFESPLMNTAIISNKQLEEKANTLGWEYTDTLLTDISGYELTYYGWQSFQDVLASLNIGDNLSGTKKALGWRDTHIPSVVRVIPKLVRVDVVMQEQEYSFISELPGESEFNFLINFRKDNL